MDPIPVDLSFECLADVPLPTEVTATDNCDGVVDVKFEGKMEGSCPITMIRTWTATDTCGNSASISQTIFVNDTSAPQLNGVPDDLTVECQGEVPPPADVEVIDNCESLGAQFERKIGRPDSSGNNYQDMDCYRCLRQHCQQEAEDRCAGYRGTRTESRRRHCRNG